MEKRFSSANYYPKKLSITLLIITLILLHVILYFFHSFQIEDIFLDIGLIWAVLSHNNSVNKLVSPDQQNSLPVEDERTVLLRRKYTRIILFWSFVTLFLGLGFMYLINKDSINIENLLLIISILFLGGLTLSSYLSKR